MQLGEIGRRASQLESKNEAYQREMNDLMVTNAEQLQDLETKAREIRIFKAESKKQEEYMTNLEKDILAAGQQHSDDVDTIEKLAKEARSSRKRARVLQGEIDAQLKAALEVGERLRRAEELNEWYKQRSESPQLGEWLREVASEQKRTDSKIFELKNAFKIMVHIQGPLPDVMDQDEEVDPNCSGRPHSRISEFQQMRTLEDELNDTKSHVSNDDDVHVMPDIQPTQSSHNYGHPLNEGFAMDIDCCPDEHTGTDYSSSHSFPSTIDSDMDTMNSESLIDSIDQLSIASEMSYWDECTASSSDEVGNDMAGSVPDCGARKMSFVYDDSEALTVDSDTQDMDWEPTRWTPRTPTINQPPLKRSRVDVVDGNSCAAEKKKQRSGSLMTSFLSPFSTKKPVLNDQTTQTNETTEKASTGVQTDESSVAGLHGTQAVEKSENPRSSSSPNTNTSTGIQTVSREPEKNEHEIQDCALTEIPGHEVQVVTPREHISLESIPRSQSGTVLLAPLSGTAARVKRRFIEGFKLLTNADQDTVLPSHQNRIRATLPNLQSDTVQDHPGAESIPIPITDEVCLEHIMQWVEHVLHLVSRWVPFLKILMVILAWLLYMWWTDGQWQWKKANEVPRNIFWEVRRGVYELGKHQSVDRVALG